MHTWLNSNCTQMIIVWSFTKLTFVVSVGVRNAITTGYTGERDSM
jgi:hypothetical protein